MTWRVLIHRMFPVDDGSPHVVYAKLLGVRVWIAQRLDASLAFMSLAV